LGQGVGKSQFLKSEYEPKSESESDEMAGSEKVWNKRTYLTNLEVAEEERQRLYNVALLCGERSKKTLFSRVGTEKITSGEGHKWFLESPQVKIMFLLS
jgi:uncharacterized protein YgiM (DUF1202 family)